MSRSGGAGRSCDVRIVTDAVGFCRLFANRVTPAELDLTHWRSGQVAEVLAAAAALALD